MRTYTKNEVVDHVKAELERTGGLMTDQERSKFGYGVLGVVHSALPDDPEPDPEQDLALANKIKAVVCGYFEISTGEIEACLRKREITFPRHCAMYFTERLTGLSLKSIGSLYGGRDHSTVIYARDLLNDLLDTDKEVRRKIAEIEKLIKEHINPVTDETV